MAKRRSKDIEWWQDEARPLPSKRQAGQGYPASCGFNGTAANNVAAPAFGAGAGVEATSALPQDGTLEVWLAVAAQVQDALAALPGWIQITQNVQAEQPEVLSSLSSASTPLALQQHETKASLPQHQQQQLQRQPQLLPFYPAYHHHGSLMNAPAGLQPSSSSPAPSVCSLQSPAAPVAAAPPLAPPHDLSAHPEVGGAALDSCASDIDTTGPACCGWFSKCRGCCQLTAGEVELHGEVVPLCRGCASSLHRRSPPERDAVIQRIMRAHTTLCQREAAAGGAGQGAGAMAGACAREAGQASS